MPKQSSTVPDHAQGEPGSTADEKVGVHPEVRHEAVRERWRDPVGHDDEESWASDTWDFPDHHLPHDDPDQLPARRVSAAGPEELHFRWQQHKPTAKGTARAFGSHIDGNTVYLKAGSRAPPQRNQVVTSIYQELRELAQHVLRMPPAEVVGPAGVSMRTTASKEMTEPSALCAFDRVTVRGWCPSS